MMSKIKVNKHLTSDKARDAIANTYVGQVHIGGTGEKGKTCRECVFFGKDKAGNYEHFGHRADCQKKGELKDGQCHKNWSGKVFQLFPHTALACYYFKQVKNPPVAKTKNPKN